MSIDLKARYKFHFHIDFNIIIIASLWEESVLFVYFDYAFI